MADIVDLCRQYAATEGNTSYGATFADAANRLERLTAFAHDLAEAKLDLHGADARDALQSIQRQAKNLLKT